MKNVTKDEMIYGVHPVMEAIQAGKELDRIFLLRNFQSPLKKELFEQLRQNHVPIQKVPVEKLNRITGKNHQGIIAFISPVSYWSIDKLLPMIFEKGETPLLLILDRITDVRNFGAICRTAECAGVHAIIVPESGSARINAEAIKTSAGALYKIPVCRDHNLKNVINYLKQSGLKIIACTEKTGNNYLDAEMDLPLALILGSEEDGISPAYLKMCDGRVGIPLLGDIGSLNVSVAAGVVLYEVLRQRN